MHRASALLLAATLALPALAQEATPVADTPLTAQEFEAYATGKTLSYAQGGLVWGSEQYLPGRKVIWAFTEDDCQYGHWFEDQGKICFVYDNEADTQCWRFFRERTGLRAVFLDGDGITSLSEVAQSDKPLSCPGPDVGV